MAVFSNRQFQPETIVTITPKLAREPSICSNCSRHPNGHVVSSQHNRPVLPRPAGIRQMLFSQQVKLQGICPQCQVIRLILFTPLRPSWLDLGSIIEPMGLITPLSRGPCSTAT